jgi:hypothetical protein
MVAARWADVEDVERSSAENMNPVNPTVRITSSDRTGDAGETLVAGSICELNGPDANRRTAGAETSLITAAVRGSEILADLCAQVPRRSRFACCSICGNLRPICENPRFHIRAD